RHLRALHSFPTRRSSDLVLWVRFVLSRRTVRSFPVSRLTALSKLISLARRMALIVPCSLIPRLRTLLRWSLRAASLGVLRSLVRSEEHTSELQSRENLVC